jgi:hypothetical protein
MSHEYKHQKSILKERMAAGRVDRVLNHGEYLLSINSDVMDMSS